MYTKRQTSQVYVNDNLFGETPIKIETMPTGKSISIRLKLEGYYDSIFENISLHKDENLILTPILNKIIPAIIPKIDLGSEQLKPTKNLIDNPIGDENVCDQIDDLLANYTCEERD